MPFPMAKNITTIRALFSIYVQNITLFYTAWYFLPIQSLLQDFNKLDVSSCLIHMFQFKIKLY